MTYHEKRQAFYEQIPHFWADLYDEEYALYDLNDMTTNEQQHINEATERIGRIFFKVAGLLREVSDDVLLDMGYPLATLDFLRLKWIAPETIIARLDLIPDANGHYKCIELNADTPTFIKELFAVNGRVCQAFGAKDPNEGTEEQLFQAVRAAITTSSFVPNPYVVFTAHAENIEDRETVRYLATAVDAPFIPLEQLQIERGVGLFDAYGQKIDVLYRQTFPIESLIDDVDQQGNPIGQWLLELVAQQKVALINPPSAFLLQNKAVQAIIWALHEQRHPFFTTREHEWIAKHFLPTYFEATPFIKQQRRYVKKPVFGREGDTVEIFDGATLVEAEKMRSYAQYVSIYQQWLAQPTTDFNSEKGLQQGQLLVGSFLVNGKASACGYRVGGRITNNLSYYLPTGLKKSLNPR